MKRKCVGSTDLKQFFEKGAVVLEKTKLFGKKKRTVCTYLNPQITKKGGSFSKIKGCYKKN